MAKIKKEVNINGQMYFFKEVLDILFHNEWTISFTNKEVIYSLKDITISGIKKRDFDVYSFSPLINSINFYFELSFYFNKNNKDNDTFYEFLGNDIQLVSEKYIINCHISSKTQHKFYPDFVLGIIDIVNK